MPRLVEEQEKKRQYSSYRMPNDLQINGMIVLGGKDLALRGALGSLVREEGCVSVEDEFAIVEDLCRVMLC
jgi:hypothetical protein